MKKKLYVVSFVCGLLLLLAYYFFPMSVNEALKKHNLNAEGIIRILPTDYQDGIYLRYDTDKYIENEETINNVLKLLNESNVVRIPFSFNLANKGKYMSFDLVVNKQSPVTIEINDDGYIQIGRNNVYRYTHKNKTIIDDLIKLLPVK